jgi:hypothetical protein
MIRCCRRILAELTDPPRRWWWRGRTAAAQAAAQAGRDGRRTLAPGWHALRVRLRHLWCRLMRGDRRPGPPTARGEDAQGDGRLRISVTAIPPADRRHAPGAADPRTPARNPDCAQPGCTRV